jgi:uncharacterized membrane protein YvbJ
MSVISCPHCNKRISDKVEQCPHCNIGMDMDADQIQRMATSERVKKMQKINVQSMIAVIVAMVGFYVMYFKSPEPGSPQLLISQSVLALGFLWYIVNRIRLFMIKNAK